MDITKEAEAIKRAVMQARKSLRPSTLGGVRPDGTPKRPEFQVGQQGVLSVIQTGLDRLRELGVRQPGQYGANNTFAENLMASLKDQKGDLKDNRNQALAVTSRDRAAQREAIQANVGILSGRTRPSSARVPRLNRGAGLLMPFSSMERLI